MCHTRLEKQLWEQSVGKLFSVPNEIISILSHASWVTNDNLLQKQFGRTSKNSDEKEREKKNKMAVAKLFVLDANAKNGYCTAFCITRKHNKPWRKYISEIW